MSAIRTTFNLYPRGESRLVIPMNSNASYSGSIEAVEALLLNNDTGGFTKNIGFGGWREDAFQTPCAIFDVAGLSFETLHECAKVILASGETDVYVRLPDGQSGWFNKASEDSPADTLAGAQHPHDVMVSHATGANAEFANIEHRSHLPHATLHGVRDTGWPHADSAVTKNRALRLLVWAAKCHIHARRQRVAGDLGALPHTSQDVQEAIDAIEAVIGRPIPAEDEGCRVYNLPA